MKTLLTKDLKDGRRVIVYNDHSERDNIIVIIKSASNIIPKIVKLTDEAEKWMDDLPKILGVSKEELGING